MKHTPLALAALALFLLTAADCQTTQNVKAYRSVDGQVTECGFGSDVQASANIDYERLAAAVRGGTADGSERVFMPGAVAAAPAPMPCDCQPSDTVCICLDDTGCRIKARQ